MKTTEKLLPAVIQSAVKPKPTKKEIVDALAQIHIEQIKAENVKRKAERERLDEEIEAGLKSLLHRKGANKFKITTSHNHWGKGVNAYLNFQFDESDLTEDLKLKIKQHDDAGQLCVPYPSDARNKIRKQMAGYAPHDTRVAALLADVDSKKALEDILAALCK